MLAPDAFLHHNGMLSSSIYILNPRCPLIAYHVDQIQSGLKAQKPQSHWHTSLHPEQQKESVFGQ